MSNKKIFAIALSMLVVTTQVSAATDAGCTSTTKFSPTTGQPCANYSASAVEVVPTTGTLLSLGNARTPEGQKLVIAVRAMIGRLKASNQKVPAVLKLIAADYRGLFTKTLTVGMKDEQVKLLQQFLNIQGFTIAKTGSGSPDKESTYFGPATKAALVKFQATKGINPASGLWGPSTRGIVEAMSL